MTGAEDLRGSSARCHMEPSAVGNPKGPQPCIPMPSLHRTLSFLATPLLALASLAGSLHAQTSRRTMQLLAPAVLGQAAAFRMTYPSAAAGNP